MKGQSIDKRDNKKSPNNFRNTLAFGSLKKYG